MNPELNNAQGTPEPANQTSVGMGPAPTPVPNPLAAPTPTPTPAPEPAPTPSQPTPLPEKKKNKTTLILVIVLVLILVGCGIAAAIMLMPKGGNSGSSSSSNGGSAPTAPDTPVEPEVSEEVELTDQTIITDIKNKLGMMMGVDWKGNYASTPSPLQGDIILLKNGSLSDGQKAFRALANTTETDWVNVPEEQKQAILNDTEYFERIRSNYSINVDEIKNNFWGYTYNAAQVREKYKEIYGEEMAKGSDIEFDGSNSFCYYLKYNSKYDIFFRNGGCGGIANPRGYYINKYTKDDNNAYLYVSAGAVGEDGVYCDIAFFNEKNTAEVCATEDSNPMIDETNYTKFAQYKITFTKADDGKYYFEKAESL